MPNREKAIKQLSCTQVNQLLLPFLHSDLAARQQESVARHLAGCSGCRDQMQETQAFEVELRSESPLLPTMDRESSTRMRQTLTQQMKAEVRMNRTLQIATTLGVILLVVVLLAGISSLTNRQIPAALPPTFTPAPQTATPVPSTPTLHPSPMPSATIRIFPGSSIPFTYQDLKFQVSQVLIDDSLGALPPTTHNVTAILFNTTDLVTTNHGQAPKDPLYNGVLIVETELQSGDKQKFLSLGLRINEGGVEKSPSAILAEDGGPIVFWVYVINQSSTSFLLEVPDQASVDVKPMIRSTPYYFNR
jgi:hypothetical protein